MVISKIEGELLGIKLIQRSHSTPSDLKISPADSKSVESVESYRESFRQKCNAVKMLDQLREDQYDDETGMAVFADRAQSID